MRAQERIKRHPAQVTNDRLLQHYEQYFSRLGGDERDAISKVREALWRIVEEDTGSDDL